MGVTWWATGDSITAGVGATDFSTSWVMRTRAALQAAGKDHMLLPGGIGGFRSDQLLAAIDGNGGRSDPDLVTIMVGMNDVNQSVAEATFQTYLGQYVDAVKARIFAGAGVIALCAVTWRNDALEANVPSFNTGVQAVAAAKGVHFIDTFPAYSSAAYMYDTEHPNDTGHQAIADIVAPALEAIWPSR